MTEASEEDGETMRSLKKRPFGIFAAAIIIVLGACALLCTIGDDGRPTVRTAKAGLGVTKGKKAASDTKPDKCTKGIPDPPVSIALIEHRPRRHRDRTPTIVSTMAMNTVTVRSSVAETCASQFTTGFIERPGEVVTAAHVLWGLDRPSGTDIDLLVSCDGSARPATIIARDDRRDTLILSAPGCDGFPVDVVDEDTVADQVLYVAGYAYTTVAERFLIKTRERGDDGWCEREAKKIFSRTGLNGLSSKMDEGPPVRYGAIETLLTHGNSGSMIIDANGKVVGMFVLFNELEGFSCYVRAGEILHVHGTP